MYRVILQQVLKADPDKHFASKIADSEYTQKAPEGTELYLDFVFRQMWLSMASVGCHL